MTTRRRPSALLALALSALLVAAAGPAAARAPQKVAGCPVFPATNVWNKRVDRLPVHPNSKRIIRAIGLDKPLHPDFSDEGGYGIPWNVVGKDTPRTEVEFRWPDESDGGPYPIPPAPRIESGGDRHVLLVDQDACRLYELYATTRGRREWS